MRRLLRLLGTREILRNPGSAALIAFSVAAGVFLLVGAQPAIALAARALAQTVGRVIGHCSLVVLPHTNDGLPAGLRAVVQAVPGVAHVVPVVDASAGLDQDAHPLVRVIGLPILSEDTQALFPETSAATTTFGWMAVGRQHDRIAVSEPLARRLHLRVGSPLALRTAMGRAAFVVAAIVRSKGLPLGADEIVLMRLDSAQAIFAKAGRVDRLQIGLQPDADVSAVQAEIATRIGLDGFVERPMEHEVADSMLRAFALTAVFLGSVVLIASGFVVFGAVSVRLAERRREVAVWRVLGATRGQTAMLMIVDAVAIGGIGSLVGLALGVFAARPLLHAAAQLVSGAALRDVSIDGITMDPRGLLVAGLAGVAVAVGASVLAVGVHTIGADAEALRALRSRWRAMVWLRCGGGIVLAALPWLSLAVGIDFLAGPMMCALFVAATFLVVPPATAWFARAILGIVGRLLGAPALIAARRLARDRFRFALPVTVLALAVEFGTAVGVVAQSFDHSLHDWLRGLTSDSLFVTAGHSFIRRASRDLDPDLGSSLAKVAGVGRVEATRQKIISLAPCRTCSTERPEGERATAHALGQSSRDVVLRVSGLAPPFRSADRNRYRFVEGDIDASLQRLAAGDAVLVSENLARRAQLHVGDSVDVASPSGPYSAEIAGVIVDFSAPGGSVIIGRVAYLSHWNDPPVDGFFVDLEPGAEIAVVRRALEEQLAGADLMVLSPPAMVAEVLDMVDRALLPLRAIAVVALAIGLWGMVQALLAATIAGAAEHGAIRAAGASKLQIGTAVLLEGLGATAIGAGFGAAAGALGAYGWVRGTIPAVTGWLVPYALPTRPVLWTIVAVLVLAPIPLLWPALRAGQLPVERWSVR